MPGCVSGHPWQVMTELSPATAARNSGRHRLDAFQLPALFLVVRCLVQVEGELAVEPVGGRSAGIH